MNHEEKAEKLRKWFTEDDVLILLFLLTISAIAFYLEAYALVAATATVIAMQQLTAMLMSDYSGKDLGKPMNCTVSRLFDRLHRNRRSNGDQTE